jgi:glucose dehydrogenase/cytochrome c5
MKRKIGMALAVLALIGMASPAAMSQPGAGATSTLKTYDPGKWAYWGGDAGQTRYAPLNQINRQTVSRLKVAWRWQAGTGGQTSNYKGTPLLADGMMYVPWMNHGMAAIDPGTGKTVWTFEPQPADIGGGAPSLALRSLAYWSNGKEKRVYHNSLDGRLIAVDAVTGKAAPGFGRNGWIDLRDNLDSRQPRGDVRSVSPALVVGNVIVVQILPGNGRNKEAAPANIRGYDVLTGKLLWTWHVVPLPGEFGNDTWKNDSWKYVGNSGTWTMMSADPETGYVYIAGDTPSNDFSGVERPGDGLFAESVTCIDTKTGKRVWHFQTVHHGTWDYDNPAAPILHDIVKDGKRIKAVTQLTKQGFMFVFDRRTGKPIWPIEERPVAASKIPGEHMSPTQPFPTWPKPLMPQGYSEDELINFTPELRAEALKIMEQYEKGPLYTPLVEVKPGLKGTMINPGYGGGANWNGAAVDPATNIMYVPIRYKPNAAGLAKGDPARTNMAYVQSGNHVINGPRGLPLLKPPYSEVVAVNMNTGAQVWRIPIGDASDFIKNSPALKGLKLDFSKMGQFDVKPSPLLIKDMFFLGESGNLAGGSGGPLIRAYDKKDGHRLMALELPALVTGAPMTYMHRGKQYIAIPISQPGRPAEIVALSLDGASDNGPLPADGKAPIHAAPKPASQTAAEIVATPAELASGKAAYDKACAVCHSPTGSGGVGPSLIGRNDYANIVRVIVQGQGEMPAIANSLAQGEPETIAKYVVKSFQPSRAARPPPPPPED